MVSYFDHAASSPLRASVSEAMASAWNIQGNPSSLHGSGRRARAIIEEARERLAGAIGADPVEVVFTSGGTEADNLAVLGSARAGARRGRPDVAAAATEHVAILEAIGSLGEHGRLLNVDNSGVVAGDDLAALDERVALLSVGWVNSETGTVQDPARTVQAAHRVGALAHSDAVQALGHVGVHFHDSGLDALSLSAHKVGGPVGIGALVLARSAPIDPTSYGGGQERRLRSGTAPVALAVGFATAVEHAVAERESEATRLGVLRARLVGGLAALPEVQLHDAARVSPAIVHATFARCRADDLLLLLDEAGVEASTGSACSAGVHQPSHVVLAMGRPEADAVSSLRFSLGPSTDADDVAFLLQALKRALPRARAAAA